MIKITYKLILLPSLLAMHLLTICRIGRLSTEGIKSLTLHADGSQEHLLMELTPSPTTAMNSTYGESFIVC